MIIDVTDVEEIDYKDLAQMIGCAVVFSAQYDLFVGTLVSVQYYGVERQHSFSFKGKSFVVSPGYGVRLEMVR